MRISLLTCLAGLGLTLLYPAAARPADGIGKELLLSDTKSWNGATLPVYPQGPAEITIVKVTLPPGAALPMHKHPVITGGYVLSGQLTVHTEAGQAIHLKAGDPLLEVVNTWHYGANDGDDATTLVVFYVGTPGQPVTVLKPAAESP